MKKLMLFFLLIGTLGTFQSCEKDEIAKDDFEVLGAPDLPSLEIFDLSLKQFGGADDKGAQPKSGNMTRWHWLHAGVNILVWNTVVVVNLATPVAALGAAFNEEAEYLGQGVYEWRYQFEGDDELLQIVLTGAYTSTEDEIAWKMSISQVDGASEFVWLTGLSTPLESEYTLYHQIENPEPYLLITHKKDANNEEAESTRFTNVIPGHEDNGNYIEYRIQPDALYNRGYDVYQSAENFLEIELNEPAGDGRVRHQSHYGDNDWRCWDEEKKDVEC
ncbi:MAG: hypothetical protein AAGG68_24945 [Bacteroidota bacterium]